MSCVFPPILQHNSPTLTPYMFRFHTLSRYVPSSTIQTPPPLSSPIQTLQTPSPKPNKTTHQRRNQAADIHERHDFQHLQNPKVLILGICSTTASQLAHKMGLLHSQPGVENPPTNGKSLAFFQLGLEGKRIQA